ncbi:MULTISPECIES: hypothetical protein [unclassified Acinetobacter]|uniref:hypothetical protein n=1 Tax=unclassified Acinetobacter TaxID=196816 RepID=UPI002934833E|nr:MULTISPECIES: hypothetical protein [unclassified Acinetobacter]WOE32242.1 hypothetical protein QSG84_03235 [Acinetobacter sp. SAAs470]WOE37712.1 hypothetical protein QSG86_12280 [Acinetobacter sp. SAAs474]
MLSIQTKIAIEKLFYSTVIAEITRDDLYEQLATHPYSPSEEDTFQELGLFKIIQMDHYL